MSPITIHSFSETHLAYCEAKGLSLVFAAYADFTGGREAIIEGGIGFNTDSGYVYLSLENGVTLASCLGEAVEFITHDDDTEIFHDSYEKAFNSVV